MRKKPLLPPPRRARLFSDIIALFAAAALFVFVLSLTYGLDLSPGFF
ncbi:hypothetical protein ACVWXQ_010368 [Bradyrhizobium sp. S3.14.4]